MKAALALFGALAVFAPAVHADQAISFNNNNLGSPRLVTFAPEFGALLGGTPVRNGVAEGASYVAQLFRVFADGSEVAIGATANFRSAATSSPGTWSGGTRTVVGVPQGTPLMLQVKAWDAAFATYELAIAASRGAGQSMRFSFQDAMSSPASPADILMVNFPGMILFPNIPEPQTVALGLLGCAAVLWLPRRPAR